MSDRELFAEDHCFETDATYFLCNMIYHKCCQIAIMIYSLQTRFEIKNQSIDNQTAYVAKSNPFRLINMKWRT